jgi:hypothetical protein
MFVIALQIALAVCMVGLRTLGMGMEFTAVLGDATCFLDDQTIRADGGNSIFAVSEQFVPTPQMWPYLIALKPKLTG